MHPSAQDNHRWLSNRLHYSYTQVQLCLQSEQCPRCVVIRLSGLPNSRPRWILRRVDTSVLSLGISFSPVAILAQVWLKIRLAFALSKTSQYATQRFGLQSRPQRMVPGDSWSTPKVRRVAKVTQEFLMVAFCGLAVATSFRGTTTQAILASTTTSSPERVAPWAVCRSASESRRSCGQCTVSRERSGCRVHWMLWASRSLQSQRDWLQRCSRLSVQLKRSRWQPNSKSAMHSSSVPRSGCPVTGGRTRGRTKRPGRRFGNGWQGSAKR